MNIKNNNQMALTFTQSPSVVNFNSSSLNNSFRLREKIKYPVLFTLEIIKQVVKDNLQKCLDFP